MWELNVYLGVIIHTVGDALLKCPGGELSIGQMSCREDWVPVGGWRGQAHYVHFSETVERVMCATKYLMIPRYKSIY